MNEVHRIDLPRIVLVGRGVLKQIGSVCEELGFMRALIVTGNKTYDIAGKRVQTLLNENGLLVEATHVSEADLETVEGVRNRAVDFRADVLIGVGGGRVIDVAKLGAARSETFFISIPTTASHDGMASCLASIKGMGKPYSVKAFSPIAIVADSQIIAESPYRLTASGCGDIISKVVSVRDWMLAHEETGEYYGDYAGSLALMSSNMVMKTAKEISGRKEAGYRTLLEALVSCGVAMSIAGSSRPCSGSEHLFSHALDMIAPMHALHGEQCAVGTIMMAKLHGIDRAPIVESLKVIGVPTTAEELGVKGEHIVEALVRAREIRPERYTILEKANLTSSDAEKLARDCGVI